MDNCILNSGYCSYNNHTYNYIETNNHYAHPYVFMTDDDVELKYVYFGIMPIHGSGSGTMGFKDPDRNKQMGAVPVYYTIKAYGVATITEAAEIGDMTGVSNNKCIIKSEVESYGCKIKEGVEYADSSCIKYVDLKKKESNLYYCKFTALEDNSTVFFRKKTTMSEATLWHLQFSYNGETWNDVTNNNIIGLNTGQTVYIRQNADDYGPARGNMSTSAYYSFGMTGSIKGGGYISSLIDGLNSNSTKSLPSADYIFYKLFSGCTALTESPIINYTGASYHGYEQMFSGCSSLKFVETYLNIFMYTGNPGTIDPTQTNLNWLYGVYNTGTLAGGLTVHLYLREPGEIGEWDKVIDVHGKGPHTCPTNWVMIDPERPLIPVEH